MLEEKLKKRAAQPSFKQFKFFHENLLAVERAKVELILNQPIFVGFAILDLSKTLMYDFHYNYIKRKYPDSTLLFTEISSRIKFKQMTCMKTSMPISIYLLFLGTKNVVKKDISHQEYVDCLFKERKFMHTMQIIRSFKHQLYTIKQNKVSLSPYDDKRYLLDDGVSCLP